MNRVIIATVLLICAAAANVFAQEHTENNKDQTLRGSGRVNASTLGMEFDLPLGAYAGRGISIPVSLNYSSKVWRMDSQGRHPVPVSGGDPRCVAVNEARFAEHSAAGWTSSMQEVYVEYTGYDDLYNGEGFPLGGKIDCYPGITLENPYNSYVRRLQIHLPDGSSHELRMDEQPLFYDRTASCTNPQASCGNNPVAAANWNGWYYAVDGSNLRYYENRTDNVYVLQLPDGSHYDFKQNLEASSDYKTIRKSGVYTDRNGNQIVYHQADAQYPGFPNGYWMDTLGRIIGIPLPENEPAQPIIQEYKMPGLNGQYSVTYKFHWKKLKDADSASSALSDFNQNLKYLTDYGSYTGIYPNMPAPRPASTVLFHSAFHDWAASDNELFNPVLLAAIELPTGQKYEFAYNEYGEIVTVKYPTGGKETFAMQTVPALSQAAGEHRSNRESNRGVASRKLYESANAGGFYEWTYLAEHINNSPEFRTVITNPDQTRVERYLRKGFQNQSTTNGNWGFDDPLSGTAYKVENFNSNNQLISKTLTSWTKKSIPITGTNITADYHPRATQEESIIYDASGNALSTTSKYEYEEGTTGLLDQRDAPLLTKKTMQYGFVVAGSPLPALPETTSETTYLQFDSNVLQASKDAYKAQNMLGLATASVVKNGAGTIVSRGEVSYDDSGYSPGFRGNPTLRRVWDSSKGAWNNPSAYITTSAKFDGFGNQYEATDANGNTTQTEYSAVNYYAYPTKVTTAVPDPNPSQNIDGQAHGSNIAFVTETTYDFTTGLPLTTKDINGQITTMEYDPATLRPKKVTPPAGAGISETIYNDAPNNYWVKNRAQIDANNWEESISYFDGLGRAYKSEEINSQGNIFVEKEFDGDGRVKRVTNPFRLNETKQWTTNIYDESSRIKEIILPDGSKVKTDYGLSVTGVIGITKQITDQAGKKRKGISDAFGRMTRVIEDPTGQNLNTDYIFDTLGNLRKTIQGEQSRYFTYNSLGRLMYAKQPEQEANTSFGYTDEITNNAGWSVKYVYDNNGNIISTTDARGVSITGHYDRINRLIYRDYSESTPDVGFFYDGTGLETAPAYSKGKTTKVSSSVSETRYTSFDNLGRLETHRQITDGQTYDTRYRYNLSGALIEETYPSGRVFSHNFDQNGDLESVWGQKANNPAKLYLNQIKYNSVGAIERMRLGNGRWESAVYNERGQITGIGLGYSNTDKSLIKIDYDYGTNTQNNGSLRKQKINYNGLANQITQDYTYDDLNRLKSTIETVAGSTSPSWRQTFDYDRFGNRTFDAAQTTTLTQTTSWKITNPSINTSDNRLKKDQDGDTIADFTYDKAGNLTIDAENKRFVFDAENRMKEFFHSSNPTQTPDAIYSYDGEGRRVKKVSGNRTVIFVYNNNGTLVAEYDSQTAANPQVSYLTADHLGSPRVITDGRGAVISRHDYMAFGTDITETIGSVGGRTAAHGYNSADSVRKQYTGYERDDESGLDFAQARYYNSIHGRFISIDPLTASASIRDPQTFNRYSYVLNSPYKFIDPLGLIPEKERLDWNSVCNFQCRVKTGIGLSKSDINLMQWHVANGTALGYSITNNYSTQTADNGSVLVAWVKNVGGVLDVSIAEGSIELKNNMVKSLGDDAAEFSNLIEEISQAHSAVYEGAKDIRKAGYGISMSGTENGSLSVTITNPEGVTYNYGVSGGEWNAGSTISQNSKITNFMSLVGDHNTIVQKRNSLFTKKKTEFQNGYNDTNLLVTSFNWLLPKKTYRRGAQPKNVKVNREFLGQLYDIRIKPVAKIR